MRHLICCLLLVLAAPARADLSTTERALVEALEARHAAALDLLQRSVDLNSGTMNLVGVRAVGDLFRTEFEALGFTTEWIEGAPFERAGHLFARHGDRGPHVLMIGHLDTVFEPDSPFQRYRDLGDGRAKGPGTTDMKGGNVILLEVLRALDAVDLLDRMTVTVALIGDEERVGRPLDLARADLRAAADAADFALGFEDGDGDPRTAVISRRGATGWTLEVTGTPAHSSQVFQPEIGFGAVFETARILDSFRRELAGEALLTFNPGLALGGTDVIHDAGQARGEAFGKSNVIAKRMVVTGDLRSISPEQLERARARMREIVADALPGTSSEIRFRDGYPPLAPTDGNRRLLVLLDRASRDLGHGPVEAVDPRNAGAADISFTSGRVEAAMDGLGLMGTGGHTLEETADLSTLRSQAQRVAVMLARIVEAGGL